MSHTYPNIHSGHNWNRYPRRENLKCELWLSFQNFSLSVTSSNSQVVTAHWHLESILVVEHDEGASSINGNSGIPCHGSSGSVGYHYGKAATGEGAILCRTFQTPVTIKLRVKGAKNMMLAEQVRAMVRPHLNSLKGLSLKKKEQNFSLSDSVVAKNIRIHIATYCKQVFIRMFFLSVAPFGSTPQPCMTTVPTPI